MLNMHRPLRIALLCSHRAPGLLHLVNGCADRGVSYEIVCCLTSERTFAERDRVERRGVPVIVHPIREFYEQRGASLYRDVRTRAAYDRSTIERLEPFRPDLIVLDSYLFLVTSPLIEAFKARILNLHYADLTERAPDGRPRFPGLRAVRDALAAGVPETRATVHLVDPDPDAGLPLLLSWPFPVSPLVAHVKCRRASDMFKAYVFAHQEWMIQAASGPLLAAAIRLVGGGAFDLAALAGRSTGTCPPWQLDTRGFLLAPDANALEPSIVR
jgi:phosphoribosylglycinamide formyltransferase 1